MGKINQAVSLPQWFLGVTQIKSKPLIHQPNVMCPSACILSTMCQPYRYASCSYRPKAPASSPCLWKFPPLPTLTQLVSAQIRALLTIPSSISWPLWHLPHMEMLWLKARWFLRGFTTGSPTKKAGTGGQRPRASYSCSVPRPRIRVGTQSTCDERKWANAS